jgi:hypothetical protein
MRKPGRKQQAGSLSRARIEGIITFACAKSGLTVHTGQIQQINSRLKTKRAKQYIESGECRGVDLDGVPAMRREAVTVAVSALGEDL